MRIFSMIVLALITANTAHATVDGNDRVALVVQNYQTEGELAEFFIERAPIIGCYGLPQGARLVQWTAEYKAPSNIGCGGKAVLENVNALSCAKVTASKEAEDYGSFSEITLDISKCEAKDNAQFITMVRTSAKINFPQTDKKKEVRLNLVK